MKRKNVLFIAISIVMVAFGGFALAVDLLNITSSDYGLRIISSISTSTAFIIAGIFGIFSKSRKTILIMVILLSSISIVDVVIGIGFFDMGLFHLTLFIWPILYLLGWRISNKAR
ncbi:MAG: hypothetical protein FWE33_02050 [Defluviitaleaceae bacterium]|nr:hypothetical protein [Defluviitaleaceae bacterium]